MRWVDQNTGSIFVHSLGEKVLQKKWGRKIKKKRKKAALDF